MPSLPSPSEWRMRRNLRSLLEQYLCAEEPFTLAKLCLLLLCPVRVVRDRFIEWRREPLGRRTLRSVPRWKYAARLDRLYLLSP